MSHRAFLPVLLAVALHVGTPGAAAAQEPDPEADPPPSEIAADTVPEGDPDVQARVGEGISPRGAFLRSLALPGWGHAEIGSYTRGAFYLSAESAVGWMLYKSVRRLGNAEDIRDLRRTEAENRLRSEGITDPFELEDAVDEDPAVQRAEGLVEARSQQREDWIALGIFFLLLGAADAYVSAQLQDFPEPIRLDARAHPAGGVDLGLRVRTSFGFP